MAFKGSFQPDKQTGNAKIYDKICLTIEQTLLNTSFIPDSDRPRYLWAGQTAWQLQKRRYQHCERQILPLMGSHTAFL